MGAAFLAHHETAEEDRDGRIGQVIDGYRLVRRIASGGMGTVYEAVHVHLGRRYAMKVLNPELRGDAQVAARFIAEGQAANQPKGPGVVAVHDVGRTADGSIYILMEYLEGVTLAARIAAAFPGRSVRDDGMVTVPTPPAPAYLVSALRLARQLASTLESIHRSGVVHRDLKPDNVFVVHDPDVIGGERVKILDFGIAKVLRPSGRRLHSPISWAPTLQRTLLGAVLGTPTYMAPEQWRGDGHVDGRTDTYGLGAILFEMFAGRPPFPARQLGDLMVQHCVDPPPPLQAVAPWVPAGLPELVQKMLAKELRLRPPLAMVRQQLAEILARCTGERPSQPVLPAAGTPAARRRTRIISGTVTLAVCLLGLFALEPRRPTAAGIADPPPVAARPPLLSVESEPSGAQLYLIERAADDGLDALLRPRCQTPCSVPTAASDTAVIILARGGYRSRTIPLRMLSLAGPGARWRLAPLNRRGAVGRAGGGRQPVRLAVEGPHPHLPSDDLAP